MADQPKSTAVPPRETWEDQPAFKEVFLRHLSPELAEACRQLGDLFYTALLEASMERGGLKDLLHALILDVHACLLVVQGLIGDHGEDVFPGLKSPLVDWQDRLEALEATMRASFDPDAWEYDPNSEAAP